MILVNADEIEAEGKGYELKSLFTKDETTFGVVRIPVGARIPLHQTGVHEQDEYSFIVQGSLAMGVADREFRVKAGDATLISAGESHWCYNDGTEEALVVWTLVGSK